ncbi:MAG: hypothetical protein MUF48_03585 [Pirellulaceae bacterium]|jgi:hypothetical protein|nr:hypothetical protein [Pirellulaceae bacterium]
MSQSDEQTVKMSANESSQCADASAVRARLLQMIVKNEESRKPKPQ